MELRLNCRGTGGGGGEISVSFEIRFSFINEAIDRRQIVSFEPKRVRLTFLFSLLFELKMNYFLCNVSDGRGGGNMYLKQGLK